MGPGYSGRCDWKKGRVRDREIKASRMQRPPVWTRSKKANLPGRSGSTGSGKIGDICRVFWPGTERTVTRQSLCPSTGRLLVGRACVQPVSSLPRPFRGFVYSDVLCLTSPECARERSLLPFSLLHSLQQASQLKRQPFLPRSSSCLVLVCA